MAVVVSTIALVIISAVVRAVPRLLVAAIASLIAAALYVRSRRISRDLLGAAGSCDALDFDRKPSRAARRAMKRSLRFAIAQTELRSLFPMTVARAECITHALIK